jgi:hypothetical protein
VIGYSQAVAIGAAGTALGIAISALFYSHSRLATPAMVLVVLLAGALFVRMLGWTVGPIVLLIATCFVDEWTFSTGKLNIRPEQIAVAAAVAIYVVDRMRRRQALWARPSFVEIALIAWFAIGLAGSLLNAPYRFDSMKILALLVLSSLAMFLPRRMLQGDQAVMDQVVAWLLLAFALEGAYATAAYFLHIFGPTVALTVNPASGHLDAFGTMWEPNVLGAVCGAGAVLWLILGTRHFHHAWIGVALCMSASVASITRTAWLAVLIVLILGMVTPVRRRMDLRALGAGLLATMVLCAGVIVVGSLHRYNPGRPGNVATAIGNGTDIFGRLNQISPVWQDLVAHKIRLLIGGGIDSFSQRHVLDGVPQHLASLEITILNDTGILGMIVFAVFVVAVAAAAWRARHDLTVIGLGAMLLVLAITNTATETLELMITWLLIGLLLAAVQVADAVSASRTADTARRSAA